MLRLTTHNLVKSVAQRRTLNLGTLSPPYKACHHGKTAVRVALAFLSFRFSYNLLPGRMCNLSYLCNFWSWSKDGLDVCYLINSDIIVNFDSAYTSGEKGCPAE